MENLRQVLYNFHRNGGGQSSISPSATVTSVPMTATVVTNSNIAPTNTQHHHIQMPLLANTPTSTSIPGVVAINSNSSSAATPVLLNHVVVMPNSPSPGTDAERIRVQAQRISPSINRSLTNMEHPIDGVINGGDGAVAATIGAAGGEGPSCTAASAANKSSDDSSDCQG